MPIFPTINDLAPADQEKLREINAKPAAQRSESESAYLSARLQYLTNEVLEEDSDGLILSARGNDIPEGYEGFAKGAEFIELDAADGTEATYVNVGDEDSAEWLPQGSIAEDTPVNAETAEGTITFSDPEAGDSVADGDTITIGSDIYEFDDDDEVGEGHILVDISGGATADDAGIALDAAITADGTEDVTSAEADGVVTLTAGTPGAAGNLALAKSCAHAALSGTAMTGGVDATTGHKGEMRVDSDYLYVCIDDNTVAESNWRRVDLGSAY